MDHHKAEQCVLMPMRVNVLLVGRDRLPSAGATQSYAALPDAGVESVEAELSFAPDKDNEALECGAHVHWLLPGPVSAGRKQQNGEVEYRPAPDRWLVTRVVRGSSGACAAKSWMVESSHLDMRVGKDCFNARSRTVYYPADRDSFCRFIGRAYPYNAGDAAPTASTARLDKLTAVLPGDLTFAAYYPNCRNVFGFHDALEDVPSNAKLAYIVQGWYSRSTDDPITGCVSVESALDTLGIQVSALPAAPALLLHGFAHGLEWKGAGALYPTGVPSAFPDIAIGFTSAHAMEALGGEAPIQALQMLFNGDADALDSGRPARESEYERMRSFFSRHTRGTVFSVKLREDAQPPDDRETCEHEAAIRLTALNKACRLVNRMSADVDELRRQVYYGWCRLLKEGPDFLAENQARIEKLAKEIDALNQGIAAGQRQTSAMRDELTRLLGDAYHLPEIPDDTFYAPNDPVVLLSGEGAEDARRQDGSLLKCRVAADVLKPTIAYTVSPAPKDAPQLWAALASEALGIADKAAFKPGGVAPLSRAINEGQAPFDGVFMNWQAVYEADSALQALKPIPSHWALNGVEYLPEKITGMERPVTVEGSIIVTPHMPAVLSAALRKTAERASGAKERLMTLARRVASLNVKSQRLSGFFDYLLTRRTAVVLPVNTFMPNQWDYERRVAELCGEQYEYLPMSAARLNHLGGGMFKLDKLALADEYGRLYAPEFCNTAIPPEYATGYANFMVLPPRFVEPYRLNARALCGSECDDIEDTGFDAVSPLLGWVAPDRINRALLLYDIDGAYCGALLRGKTCVEWEASLLPDAPALSSVLQSFRDTLTGRDNAALDALFTCAERCPGVMNPQSGGLVSSLSLFYGRPLALARVAISIEPMRTPARSTGQPGGNPLGYRLPVTVGDNQHMNEGLVGFFKKDSFDVFYTCTEPGVTGCGFISTDNRVEITVSLDGTATTELTLLLEPTSPVHVISGLLPVNTLRLPDNAVKTLCDRVRVFMRTGPMLSGKERPEMPYWQRRDLTVRWLERKEDGTCEQLAEPIQPDETMAVFGDGILLRDGYLAAGSAEPSDTGE